jgi:membrane protein DedA with SNARE-associated domain
MVDWITQIISATGYLGIFLLMLAENIFPPIPSELIMPLAGFVAGKGELHPLLVGLAGSGGSALGALLWYYVGKWLGKERVCHVAARYGRWMTLDEKEVNRALTWFERHGGKAVFGGRLVPAVRTLISVPAGIAHMALGPFLLASTSGTIIWTGCLTTAGVLLKNEYELVSHYVDGVSQILLGLIVLTYLYRVMAGGSLGGKVRQWTQCMYRDLYTVYFVARDARVPWYARIWALLIAAYVVSPIDLIPDVIPILGHFDDAILVPFGIWVAMRLTPGSLLYEHRQHAATFARQPTQWWVGVVFVAMWIIVLLFVLRWLMKVFIGSHTSA